LREQLAYNRRHAVGSKIGKNCVEVSVSHSSTIGKWARRLREMDLPRGNQYCIMQE
jgi:hypothetical protein